MGLDQSFYVDDIQVDTSGMMPTVTEIAAFHKNYSIHEYMNEVYNYEKNGHYGDCVEITLDDAIAMCKRDESSDWNVEAWGNIFVNLTKNRKVYYAADW